MIKTTKSKWLWASVGMILTAVIAGFVYYSIPPAKTMKAAPSKIEYGQDSEQNFKIYQPKNKKNKKTPVILYLHGGGWSGGDKSNVSEKPAYFNKKGYTFISMNYRLSPKASYTEMVDDVTTVLKWIKKNEDEYRFDLNELRLMGHSAGGHLAMLAATDPQHMERANLSPKMIHSVINIEGPVNIQSFVKEYEEYQDVFGNDPATVRKASPLTFAKTKKLPPVLFIAHDDPENTKFIEDAKGAQNKVYQYEAITTSHSDLTKDLGTDKTKEAIEMTDMLTKFLDETK